jgi:alanine racemase
MLGRNYHYDLARPGYALYGGQPSDLGAMPVEPVVTVTARVLQVHDVPPAAAIGYNGTYRTNRPMRVATIAAGYADGFFRHASASVDDGGGAVAIGGRIVPVVGRVSMDLITVDVTGLPAGAVARGTEAELIGRTISLAEAGRRAGSIGYEVLTRLSPRFARVYVGGGEG